MELKLLDYFKNSLEDALYGVSEIIYDSDHPQYENAMIDIDNIDIDELEDFITAKRIDRFLDDNENLHLEKCKCYLISKIQKDIAKSRLKALTENTRPYNSENLVNLQIGENQLVSIKQFEIYNNGFKYNDKVYSLTHVINGSNSSYWITQSILSLAFNYKLDFKIRLDPFIEIHHSEYSPMAYKMTIYGKPLDWERLKNLRDEEYGQWMNDDNLSNNNITDYVWRPENNEIHFTCEELPNIEEVEIRGSRYFHAIFNKETGKIIHCDGAIRIYSKEELTNRLGFHVRKAEVRKVGTRIKIFQLDEEIGQDAFVSLITNFMVWNNDVLMYFNNK
jgi:hypothetical protein